MEIPLTHGKVAIIDDSDAPLVEGRKWQAIETAPGYWYAVSDGTYMHRLLLDAPKGLKVDHRNHDRLDNRRFNIRIVTHAVNLHNRKGPNTNNKSGARGVSVARTPKVYWLFNCASKDCRVMRYFPYTDEGLEAAKALSQEHYN